MLKARAAFFWSILNAIGTRGLSSIFFIIISRHVGPSVFGVMSVGIAFSGIVDIFTEQGLSTALIQKIDLSPEHKNSAFLFQVGLATLVALVVFFSSSMVARLFSQPQLRMVLCWLAPTFIMNAAGFSFQAIFKKTLQFKYLALRNFIATMIGGIVGLGMVLDGYGVESLIALTVVNSAVGLVILCSTSQWRPGFSFSKRAFLDLHSIGRSISANQLLEMISGRVDQLIIGYIFGTNVLGYYAFAMRLYEILMNVTGYAIAEVVFPLFSHLQSDLSKFRQTLLRLSSIGGGLTVPLFLLVALTSPLTIPLVFGHKWIPSIAYSNWILTSGSLFTLGIYSVAVFNAVGRPGIGLLFRISNLIMWGLGLFLLPVFGPTFAAASWVGRALIIFPVQIAWSCRLLNMPILDALRSYGKIVISCLLMTVVVLPIVYGGSQYALLRAVSALVLGAITYMYSMRWFDSELWAFVAERGLPSMRHLKPAVRLS